MYLETLTLQRTFGIVRHPDKSGKIQSTEFGFEAEGLKVYSAKVLGNPPLRDGMTLTLALPKAKAWREICGWLDHQDGSLHQRDSAVDWHWVGASLVLTAMPLAFALGAAKTQGARIFLLLLSLLGLLMVFGMTRRLLRHSRALQMLNSERLELQRAGTLPPSAPGFRSNHIPGRERLKNTVFSLFLLAYGAVALRLNDFFVPTSKGSGIHFYDTPARLMVGAVVCACLVMLSVVMDHYDRRDNERHYRRFANVFCLLGYAFVAAAVFLKFSGGF